MVKDFKFLQDNDNWLIPLEDWNGPSWMYGKIEDFDQCEYDIVTENHYGIHSFLNLFPDGLIVTVLSIVGPNNRIHSTDTHYEDGWGFDILNDLITIEWVRFG